MMRAKTAREPRVRRQGSMVEITRRILMLDLDVYMYSVGTWQLLVYLDAGVKVLNWALSLSWSGYKVRIHD